MPDLERRIAAVAADRQSGASKILLEVISILRDALAAGSALGPVAQALCRAQPTMAPVWNAALEALAPEGALRLERFAARLARSAGAIGRFAIEHFRDDAPGRPLRIVTISFSGTVVHTLAALHRERPIALSCSESRPGLEGRTLAARMAATGIPIICFGDAAIGHALADADAVVVGADAVTPDGFINKSGTRMLAAAASQQGLPVYVVASRDKFASRELARRLANRDGGGDEIWSEPPAGVTVLNPYFELTPLDLIAAVISDIGVLSAALVPDACTAAHDSSALQRLGTPVDERDARSGSGGT